MIAKNKSLENQIFKNQIQFIKKEKSSYASLEWLYYLLNKISEDSCRNLYDNLKKEIKNSFIGKQIDAEITKKKYNKLGTFARNFFIVNTNSNSFMLSNARKKSYVLVSFWASWCKPCREEFKQIKSILHINSNPKIEVVCISIDKDSSSWYKAIQSDSINHWKHFIVSDYPKINSDSMYIFNNYYIDGVPLNILIDKEGYIIGKWDGSSSKMLEKINKIVQVPFPN